MKWAIATILAVLSVGAFAQTGPCANIRTRAAWGARAANPGWLATQPPNAFVVHHTFSPGRCGSQAACDTAMRGMQNHHMNTNGWADIGYNFCIGDTAVIYEARGWNRAGAHAPGFNSRSIGFCFIGDHTSALPLANVLSTAQAFVICARDWGRLTTTYR